MCFQSATTTEIPDFVAHDDLWFEDGNVLVLATDPDSKVTTAFRVHAGMLIFQSQSLAEQLMEQLGFEDMESLFEFDWTESDTYLTFEDHPVDIAYWLTAIYDGLDFDILDKKRLATLRGVLLLSDKYAMGDLYKTAYDLLIADYPARGSLWAEREKRCRSEDGTQMYHPLLGFSSAIHAIQLARELDIPEILPAAFYDLSRYTVPNIRTGTGPLPGGEHIPLYNAKINHLSEKDFDTLNPLKEWLFRYLRDFCQAYLDERRAAQNCETPDKKTCKMAYDYVCEKVMRMMIGLPGGEKFRRADKTVVDPLLALERIWVAVRQRETDIFLVDVELAKLGDTEPKPVVCCAACAETLRAACLYARRTCWDKMFHYVSCKNLITETKPPTPLV